MKILNPFDHLEPRANDSFAEMMQGAFWTMLAFLVAEMIFKIFILILVYEQMT